jgi:hypothetical protein
MARAAAREPAPRVTLVRRRTVEVDWIVPGLGQQAEQLTVAFRVIVDVPFGNELTGLVHQGHVMVILGPVDSAGDRQPWSSLPVFAQHVSLCRDTQRPNRKARWPDIR